MYSQIIKGNSAWDNNLTLGYGEILKQSVASWIKSDDRILLTSKVWKKAVKIGIMLV